jgi:hypothetical protein
MRRAIETRIAQLEKIAGNENSLDHYSDAELDAALVDVECEIRAVTSKADHSRLDEELLSGQPIVGGEVNLTYEALFMPRTFALMRTACVRLGRESFPGVESPHPWPTR